MKWIDKIERHHVAWFVLIGNILFWSMTIKAFY